MTCQELEGLGYRENVWHPLNGRFYSDGSERPARSGMVKIA
jgi:hypothetical protein